MEFVSRYVAHQPDAEGFIVYDASEHEVWGMLFKRQMQLVQGRACDAFLKGLDDLALSADAIPQLPDVSAKLCALTGWEVAPVAALISARAFFELLADKKFPAATFIRVKEELDYIQEPDIFHEIFGHCPMLTDPVYADFIQQYAQKVLSLPEADWPLLQRMFWFTVEFGLIRSPQGLRAYGGGILSSIKETVYCLESDVPMRVLFEPVAVYRTPYRIDKLQAMYFVIDSYDVLYDFAKSDMSAFIARARELGEFKPLFAVDKNNPNIHILAC